MAKGSLWAPLLLCLLQPAPGSPYLTQPQNVTLFSRNFRMYLTWHPGPNYPSNVTYVVNYQSIENYRWKKVKHCKSIAVEECDLTCPKSYLLNIKFKGRVRALASGTSSPWAESKYLEYLFDVELAPPILTWTWKEENLIINATFELPPCIGFLDLKYEVEFWKEGSPNKTRSEATFHGKLVKFILSPASVGNYCLNARTVYVLNTSKYSKFSEPVCFLLRKPETQQKSLTLMLLFFLVIIIPLWVCLLKSIYYQHAKMPQSLDFSGHKCSVKTLKVNTQETFGDLSICPKSNLQQRRPSPGSGNPSTLQPSEMEDNKTEESEKEEFEDMDDSGTFEPYLEISPLKGMVTGMGKPKEDLQSLESTGSLTHPGSDFSLAMYTLDSGNVSDSGEESGTISCSIKDDVCGNILPLSPPKFLKESEIKEEPSEDSLSSRASPVPLNPSSLRLEVLPRGHLTSLQTLIINIDRGNQDSDDDEGGWLMEVEDEEEEEMGDGSEEEVPWNENSKRPKVTDYQHSHYMLH